MSKKSMWSFKLSTVSLVMIPVAVCINYVGKLFASALKLPLWLDSIGTVLASMLGGPILGALSGAINNIIFGLTADPMSFVYAGTSIAIGLVAGILAYKGWMNNFGKALVSGLIVSIVAAVVSTPLNIKFWGGQTGNAWGDAVFGAMMAKQSSLWLASFVDEVLVDVPDKIVTVLISFAIFKSLPKQLTSLFASEDEIKQL